MTSAAIQNEDWAENLAKFVGAKFVSGHSTAPNSNHDIASEIPIDDKSSALDEDRQVTFAEIFKHALPSSPKIIEFNDLIEHIWTIKQGTSLVDRDDSKISEAIFIISDILDIYWSEFPIKAKVLLLNKLQVFNKSGWQFALELMAKIPNALKDRAARNKAYTHEYNSLDRSSQANLERKFATSLTSLFRSIFRLCNTTRKIFKKDGRLLRENQENIQSFTTDIQELIKENLADNIDRINNGGIVHAFNQKGEPFTYNIKDLFWNPKAYDYLKEQEELFDRHLPELIESYAGRYVVFENGLVIDSDEDENVLLDRICDTEFYKQRPDAMLFTFVPRSLLVNA
jgi:hypothetical protein